MNTEKKLVKLYQLWDSFDTPVNHDDELVEPFLHFPAGTERTEVWLWFESLHPLFCVHDAMSGAWRSRLNSILGENPEASDKATGGNSHEQLQEICEAAAAAMFTSGNSEHFYEDAYRALADRPDDERYPEGIYPWSPFEHETPSELMEIIDGEAEFLFRVFSKTLETIEEQLKEKGIDLQGLKLKELAVRHRLIA